MRLAAGLATPLALMLAGCDKGEEAKPGDDEIIPALNIGAGEDISAQEVTGEYLADPGNGENWPSETNGYSGNRFSPLSEIDRESITDLGLLWAAPLSDGAGRNSTPIAVDGRIYFGDAVNGVSAYEAVTGQRIWQYDPGIGEAALSQTECAGSMSGGVAIARGRLFLGQRDGRLTALDASTGAVLWSSQTSSRAPQPIAGAPIIVGNNVIVGTAAPCGNTADTARGHVSAYVAQDGQMDWRFSTVPTRDQVLDAMGQTGGGLLVDAAQSWASVAEGASPAGGFVPGNIAYDAENGDLLFGTGPRLPLNAQRAGGRGLFAASLIALDPESGRYRWHRQLAPGGTGWSANAPILFAPMAQTAGDDAEKNDEASDDAEKASALRAKTDGAAWMPLENGWLVAANAASKYLGYSALYGRSSPVSAYDADKGGAQLSEDRPLPALKGVHAGYLPASHSPETGLFYLHRSGSAAVAGDDESGTKAIAAVKQALIAYAPATGKPKWSISGAGAAPLVTAGGLLFARYDAGFGPGLAIFDAESGDRLYFRSDIVPLGGMATFMAGGRQIIAFPAIANGRAQMVAMGLGGRLRLGKDDQPAP